MLLTKIKPAQFLGIEINPFAVKVLKVCFLLIELKISGKLIDISVLDKNIITANALRMDWNKLLPNKKCSYIISNPPFCGVKLMTDLQRLDREITFGSNKFKKLDYVSCWYKKSIDYMLNTKIKAALVSTSSIVQGEQVPLLWEPLFKNGVNINFAYQPFKWNSESSDIANVLCVIVGFSYINCKEKIIYNFAGAKKKAKNINGYLLDAENIFVKKRLYPLHNDNHMQKGSQLIDGGNFLFNKKRKNDFLKKYPKSEPYFYKYINAKTFLNGKEHLYCLCLKNCSQDLIARCPGIRKIIEKVYKYRLNSKAISTNKLKDRPCEFFITNIPNGKSLFFPIASSCKREYVPIGFMKEKCICTNAINYIENANIYQFGILTSSAHMNWMRAVCGRLGVGYRYSKDIVYNTFPWPNPTKKQKENIEKTAKMILNARKLYPNCTLAQLYDPLTMPPELRKAHKLNDEAVLKAYGFSKNITEEECVAKLMEMYKELVERELKKRD